MGFLSGTPQPCEVSRSSSGLSMQVICSRSLSTFLHSYTGGFPLGTVTVMFSARMLLQRCVFVMRNSISTPSARKRGRNERSGNSTYVRGATDECACLRVIGRGRGAVHVLHRDVLDCEVGLEGSVTSQVSALLLLGKRSRTVHHSPGIPCRGSGSSVRSTG